MQTTEDEPRAVCRRLDDLERFIFDLSRLSSREAAFSPKALMESEDVGPTARAALALSQVAAFEKSHLQAVVGAGMDEAFLQRSALFIQSTLARQERACVVAALAPPLRAAEEEADVEARILEAEAELCAVNEQMTELRRQEEELAAALASLVGHAAAEAAPMEVAGADEAPPAAAESERAVGELLQRYGQSHLHLRRMWETVEKSGDSETSGAAVARRRAWANFGSGRPEGRHALMRLA